MVREGYKQTEIGVIPEDWIINHLNSITSEVGDGIHATPIYSSNGKYFFVNGNNLINGQIIVSNDTKKTDVKEFNKNKKPLDDRTILLSINGTIGNIAFYYGEPIVLGKSAAYLNIKRTVSKQYIYYILQTKTVKRFFADGLTGTTIKNLGLGTIRNTPIAIPNKLKEQTLIAQALSDVDALITSLDKLIAKKRAIKTATMQQLLTGKKRLPGFGEGKGYKKSEIGVIPEDWEVKPLELICIPKGLVRGPFGGSLKKEFFTNNGFKVYEQRNAIYSDIKYGSYFVNYQKFSELQRFEVLPGDFIISCSGTIGRIFLIPQNAPKGIINQALLKITTDDHVIHKDFFIQYFGWDIFQEKITDSTQGGAMKNLVGMSVFKETKIPLASSKTEQIAIAQVLSEMDSEITTLQSRLNKTKSIKQGMMQELLTGKTRLIDQTSGESL